MAQLAQCIVNCYCYGVALEGQRRRAIWTCLRPANNLRKQPNTYKQTKLIYLLCIYFDNVSTLDKYLYFLNSIFKQVLAKFR